MGAENPVVTETDDFDLNFVNPCSSLTSDDFTSTPQANSPVSTQLDGNPTTFGITEFTITPSLCPVTYSCGGVDPEDFGCDRFTVDGIFDGDLSDGTFVGTFTTQDYIDGNVTPGDYVITIVGTESFSGASTTETFTLSVPDPCDPPNSVASTGLTDQVYTLTTTGAEYTH